MPGGEGLVLCDRTRIFVMFILALLLMPFGPHLRSSTVDAAVVEDPLETPDGLMWAAPVKVTQNDLDDRYPSIRLDVEGNANIVYLQSGSEYMWAEIAPPSDVLVRGKRLLSGYIPTQYQVKNESTAQPTEFFDTGPDGDIHVVWTEAGLLDNRYQRFDGDGEPVTSVIPMDQITDLSRLPYLVVGKNDNAYIAFENEGTAWVQMTFVDDQGYIRAPALIGRPGENVAFARGEDGLMHLFYRSLGADVSLYHVKLDEDRKAIVPSDIIFPNTSKVANPYSSMPTIFITPNGHVHLLVSDTTIAPHPIYYIELDPDGVPIRNFTKVVDAAYNYGDVVGDPENNVYVFWDDFDDGEVHYRKVVDGVPGEEVTITSTGGKARYPQVMSDTERGDIHLAYVDISEGGEGEIFYRYANGFRIELEVQGLEKALEIHPGGGTVELELVIHNIGEVENEVTVSSIVDYNGLEGHGWDFVLNGTTFDIGPGGVHSLRAFLKGPTDGVEGEMIRVELSAVPTKAPVKGKTLSFSPTLTITHSIGLEGPTRLALKERETLIGLDLWNDGDVEENITLVVAGGPPGWEVSIGASHVLLGPGSGTENIDLAVTMPDWVVKDQVSSITVEAMTGTDPAKAIAHEIDVVAYPTVFPVVVVEGDVPEMAPGRTGHVPLKIRNEGLGSGTFDLEMALQEAHGDWRIDLSPARMTLGPDDEGAVDLGLTAPVDARTGPGVALKVYVTEDELDVIEEVGISVDVMQMGGLDVTGGGKASVFPGERASFDVVITNAGNSKVEVDLSVQSLPEGWKWQFWRNGVVLDLSLLPYSRVGLRLEVTPPLNAPPTQVDVIGTVEGGGAVHPINASVSVLALYGSAIHVGRPIAKAVPGTSINFSFELANTGTSNDLYELTVGDTPHGVTHVFRYKGAGIDMVTVGPRETVEVLLIIELSPTMKVEDFTFWLGARSETGVIARADIIIEFRMADVRIKDVVFDDEDLKAGDSRRVVVLLANPGDGTADDCEVVVNGEVRSLTLGPGEDGELDFDVVFEPWHDMMIVVVDPDNHIQERREDNNIEYLEVDVEGEGGILPGFGSPAIFTLMLFFYFYRRFRKR